MKNLLLLLIFASCFHLVKAQHPEFGKEWITGGPHNYYSNFSSSGVVNSFIDSTKMYIWQGSSSICDSTGKVILFTEGCNIRNRNRDIIDYGGHIVGNEYYIHENGFTSYSQSTIILPFEDSIFMVIVTYPSDSMMINVWNPGATFKVPFDRLEANLVDMKLNGGQGKVTNKNIPILNGRELSKTQMMACRHANGNDWWLLKVASDSTKIYKFLISKNNIQQKEDFSFNNLVTPGVGGSLGIWDNGGMLTFSPDGKHLVTGCNSFHSEIFMADFDRCTGEINNPKHIIVPFLPTGLPPAENYPVDISLIGLCYSPNGQFLYIVKYFNIWQFDLNDPDSTTAWYQVANMDTTFSQFQGYGPTYLAYNNKIYIGNWNGLSNAMSSIDNPDIKGVGCNFCPRCFKFPYRGVSSPSCMPNWNLGKDLCWPLNVDEESYVKNIEVYPNPTSGILFINVKKMEKETIDIKLFSIDGKLLHSSKNKNNHDRLMLDFSYLSRGIYYLKVQQKEVNKIIIE